MTAATTERGTMPLAGHLREARSRGARSAVALVIASAVGFWLADPIMNVLREPIEQLALTRSASLNYNTVTGAFDLKLKIAVVTGVVLSSPVWTLQLLQFLAPGLNDREKRFTYGFLGAAVPLFALGCGFGFLLFPHMVQVLTSFSSDQDSTILTAPYYVDFVLKIVLATGIAFVLPVFVVMLNLLGAVSARSIRQSWRFIVVVITLFSALVTPAADVLSMFLVAVPMALLFGAAGVIAHVHDRRVQRRAAVHHPVV